MFNTPKGRGQSREVNFALPLCPLPGGSDLTNSTRFRIYTIENTTFDTSHNGRDQKLEINFCPSPFAPTLAPPTEGGGVGSLIIKDSSRFGVYTIENPTYLVSHTMVEVNMGEVTYALPPWERVGVRS